MTVFILIYMMQLTKMPEKSFVFRLFPSILSQKVCFLDDNQKKQYFL